MTTKEKLILKEENRIKGIVQAAIWFSQDLSEDLQVSYYVNYRELFNDYTIDIEHQYAFDNHKKETLFKSKEFSFEKMDKNILFEISSYLDNELSNVVFDNDYDSNKAKLDFEGEIQSESSRGN